MSDSNEKLVPPKNAPIKLSRHEVAILGAPNFSVARMAEKLIRAGVYELADRSSLAENLQAIAIHWMLSMHKEHGDDGWLDACKARLDGAA